ncbi:MAG: NAD(P)H-hydrate dehydratase, partial [Candidatus Diapherotrites archaeon]
LSAMSALSSLRTGIDLAVIAAPEKAGWAMSRYSPDIIVKKFNGDNFSPVHAQKIISLTRDFDAVLIGPGLGTSKNTAAFVHAIVKQITCPLVVDADAIKALAGFRFSTPVILTPHKTEFEIFTGVKFTGVASVMAAAKKHNCTILLKSQTDIISDGVHTKQNSTGNSGMTVGGTGDVLAGICAALLALHNAPFRAACAAAYINGKAGDILLKKKGYGFIAGDFPSVIPEIIKKFR